VGKASPGGKSLFRCLIYLHSPKIKAPASPSDWKLLVLPSSFMKTFKRITNGDILDVIQTELDHQESTGKMLLLSWITVVVRKFDLCSDFNCFQPSHLNRWT